jgi:hypothetical protein
MPWIANCPGKLMRPVIRKTEAAATIGEQQAGRDDDDDEVRLADGQVFDVERAA